MADECPRYHSRLAELSSAKKARELRYNFMGQGKSPLQFCRARSYACLRGSRTLRRRNLDIKDSDLEIEKGQTGLP